MFAVKNVWPSCTHKIFENFPFLKMQIFEIFGDVRIQDYRGGGVYIDKMC